MSTAWISPLLLTTDGETGLQCIHSIHSQIVPENYAQVGLTNDEIDSSTKPSIGFNYGWASFDPDLATVKWESDSER